MSYTVYFGATASPLLYKENVSSSSLADVPVNAATTYDWMVVTKDSKGNTSTSEISQFKTN